MSFYVFKHRMDPTISRLKTELQLRAQGKIRAVKNPTFRNFSILDEPAFTPRTIRSAPIYYLSANRAIGVSILF